MWQTSGSQATGQTAKKQELNLQLHYCTIVETRTVLESTGQSGSKRRLYPEKGQEFCRCLATRRGKFRWLPNDCLLSPLFWPTMRVRGTHETRLLSETDIG
jgi:hypothetical protein